MKIKSGFMLIIIALISLMTLNNCTTASIGEETIVEKSDGDSPDWLYKTPKDKEGRIFFVGRKDRVFKRNLGIQQAKAAAISEIAKKISMRVRTEFVETATGNNINEDAVMEHLDYTVAYVADNVRVSAVQDEEIYWERVKVITSEGIKYYFNIYTLLSIPRQEYEKAKRLAAQNLMGSKNKEAQKLGKEVMNRLLEK